ncbi:endonuclease III [Candidatus Gottesmanbacteria bacterium RIFCSPHIGHO2_01_FULL_39_10]|uniref:Endonuclease III n=1 Tax=Candidatus Gottesmanbacteria bacterium RIFCSPHIGHO2_01_FULL_39_10 TaxID=1798375 RepID=A0A1F5ZSQ7_9BACT|nr:MAG: endonuclease III [Candidatus Gottesmanbacteria bacterium RIFCSPHIGHO2_01_FULL_39_10]
MTKEEKVQEILKRLYKIWPKPKIELNYSNPLELLVAVILSAQATDKTVNKVTPELFKKYKSAADYSSVSPEKLDTDIRRVNFHFNKAKNIVAASRIIAEKYDGKVPETMEELDALPGVARKTANVVLSNAFGKAEGIVIDTHMIRLSNCLELTKEKDPVKIEQDLMKIVTKDKWIDFAHLLILYGRYYCTARMKCTDCQILGDLCHK